MNERWYLQSKKADFYEIGKKFNINPIVARLIRNRDVVGDEQISEYLNPNMENLSSPWLMKDMDTAVDLLRIKISQNNKIRIICDYDVDGVCSGYILHRAFKDMGADVSVVVPHRIEDGYGINERLIRKAYEEGVDTIVTCDNGISAYEQTQFAKSLGMTIIITDHHQVPYEEKDGEKKYILPKGDAVIDPQQQDCAYPFKELCGAMVAYQLVRAIYDSMGESSQKVEKFLIYGAMATVCDIVELKGENRAIVKAGLEQIKRNNDVGINALIDACNINKNNIDTYHIGFIIGPCLNAGGRLDTAKKSMDLLEEEDREKADRLAEELTKLNAERKDMTEKGTMKAVEIGESMTDPVLIIFLEECHESIAGIIAGRVREKYNKPVIILTDCEDGVKGSGRSIEEYNMYEELTKVKDLFTKYGGHRMAAGLSMKKENVDLLRKRLNENCNLTEEDLYLKVWIDMQLPLEYVTIDLIRQLQLTAPWGKGNEKPVFAEKNLKVLKINIFGKQGNVLRLEVENDTCHRMTAVIFNKSQEFMELISKKFGQQQVNLAMEGKANQIRIMATYFPQINEYRGMQQIQIVINRFC